jgi:2'-5' RNA ligase
METIRAFVAIPLPESLLEQLGRLQRRLEIKLPPRTVRWVKPRGIHLTLKFLGDTPADTLPGIKAALATVARHAPASSLSVEGLGCFPNPSRPRVLWVGVVEPSGKLAALQDAIEEALSAFGYQPEGRGFTAHLTLGRVNRRTSRDDARQIGEVVKSSEIGSLGEVEADRFALIRSILKPTGAEYTTLETFQLG